MTKTVLTVDDSRTMRDMLLMALEDAGYTVIQAVDGVDGLETLAAKGADVVITDINMPRMDGFTFIKTVREQDAYRDLPIVVLSTEGQEKDIQKEITLGANLYMVKPAQPQQMVRNIKMLLG